MRRVLAVVVAATTVSGPAAADPASVRGYAEPSLLGGIFTLHGTDYGERVDKTSAVFGLRLTVGLRLDDVQGHAWRFGASFSIHGGGGTLGIESSVDWPISTEWRLGPRLEVGRGDDSEGGEGLRISAGVTARRGALTFGLDASGGRSYFPGSGLEAGFDGYSAGLLSRVGLSGRPGVYAEITIIVVGFLALGALGAAMGGGH